MVTLNRADISNAPALLSAINRELPGTVTTEGSGDSFVFYDPDGITVPERRIPFITVVTGDRYDAASRLDRDAASFRVNLGVDRATYEALFGPAPRQAAGREVIDTGFDYTTPDRVMPHPFYAAFRPWPARTIGATSLTEIHGKPPGRSAGVQTCTHGPPTLTSPSSPGNPMHYEFILVSAAPGTTTGRPQGLKALPVAEQDQMRL